MTAKEMFEESGYEEGDCLKWIKIKRILLRKLKN